MLVDPRIPLSLFAPQHPRKDAGDGEWGVCTYAPKLSRVWEKVNFCHTPGSDRAACVCLSSVKHAESSVTAVGELKCCAFRPI